MVRARARSVSLRDDIRCDAVRHHRRARARARRRTFGTTLLLALCAPSPCPPQLRRATALYDSYFWANNIVTLLSLLKTLDLLRFHKVGNGVGT